MPSKVASTISISNKDNVYRIQMTGEADIDFVNAFSRMAQELEQKPGSTALVVDMKDVTYIDSASLGIFVKLIKVYQSLNNKIIIFKPRATIAELFTLTGLSRMLTICNNNAELDAALGKKEKKKKKKKSEELVAEPA